MEWPIGWNLINAAGRDPLCTLLRRKGLYGQVRYWGYMRVSRLKSKSGSSSHTGGTVQCTGKGPSTYTYSMVLPMEEYMERPRGVKMINTADGHRLCTSHRRKGLYGQVRYWGYMRDSRLKSKSGSSSHTGRSVQLRATLVYSMARMLQNI